MKKLFSCDAGGRLGDHRLPNNNNKMEIEKQEKYLELSKKIKEFADELSKLDMEKECEKDDESDNTIKDKSRDITDKFECIEEKILTIIGQMYKGVLVDQELSVRSDGKIYEYRCRYKPNCTRVLGKIKDNIQEVEGKVGKKNAELIQYLIDGYCYFEKLKTDNDNIYIKDELAIEPLVFTILCSYDDGRVLLETINKIMVDRSGIHFGNDKDNDVSIYSYEHIIETKYKDKLKEMAKKVLDSYIDIEKQMDEKLKQIEEKGAKYLIASTLECQ